MDTVFIFQYSFEIGIPETIEFYRNTREVYDEI